MNVLATFPFAINNPSARSKLYMIEFVSVYSLQAKIEEVKAGTPGRH